MLVHRDDVSLGGAGHSEPTQERSPLVTLDDDRVRIRVGLDLKPSRSLASRNASRASFLSPVESISPDICASLYDWSLTPSYRRCRNRKSEGGLEFALVFATIASRKTRWQRGRAGPQELALRMSSLSNPGWSSYRPTATAWSAIRFDQAGRKNGREARVGGVAVRRWTSGPEAEADQSRPETCWDGTPATPVEITAPDRESASALLDEAVRHFRAELVETAGPGTGRQAAACATAPTGWVFELLALVERWLEARNLQVAKCAPRKPKLRDHCPRSQKPLGRRSRSGRRRLVPMPTPTPAPARPDREREARPARVARPGRDRARPRRDRARDLRQGSRGGDGQGAAGRRDRRARGLLRARARADLRDRPRGVLPGDRAPPRRRPRLHPRGREARRLRLHHRRHPRRAAERDRHHAAALHRVPQPPGRVRPPRHDRAGEGHPDGPPLDQRRHRLRRCCATTPSTTAASSPTSPPRSSRATCSCFRRVTTRYAATVAQPTAIGACRW